MAARKATTGASRRISLSASAQCTAPLATTMAAAGMAATASGSPQGRSTAKPSTTNSSKIEEISAATISYRYGDTAAGSSAGTSDEQTGNRRVMSRQRAGRAQRVHRIGHPLGELLPHRVPATADPKRRRRHAR